jgi:NIMA (never in mitosis gene a)-related kinase
MYLQDLKEKGDFLSENQLILWFTQLLMALNYIHQNRIIHRDIKTSNIFITQAGNIKLGDFGISKVLINTNQKAFTLVGTPFYLSPEMCESKPYSFQSDMWSVGCVLFEMASLSVFLQFIIIYLTETL